jgi:hypothetical protein
VQHPGGVRRGHRVGYAYADVAGLLDGQGALEVQTIRTARLTGERADSSGGLRSGQSAHMGQGLLEEGSVAAGHLVQDRG